MLRKFILMLVLLSNLTLGDCAPVLAPSPPSFLPRMQQASDQQIFPLPRSLTQRWSRFFLDLTAASSTPRPKIYAECWFGKHVRMTGGLTFIHDLLQAAGGEKMSNLSNETCHLESIS